MCHVLEVSRSGYYRWRTRRPGRRADEDRNLVEKIQEIHADHQRLYGYPRITRELRETGWRCSRHRIARLMRKHGIRAKVKRKFRRYGSKVMLATYAPNRLERQFDVSTPNRVWVTDLTYLWTREGALYLAAVLDLNSRLIVGWATAKQPTARLALQALQRALGKRRPENGLMIHSDRGSQFASFEYQGYLQERGYVASMNQQGTCYDNAVMESFFHTLKMEHVYWESFRTREEASLSLFGYIELYYNSNRRHSYLGYKSPMEYEKAVVYPNEVSTLSG